MGHDHITLKHDYDNLLIDRRMLDHSITGSVVYRQKSHMKLLSLKSCDNNNRLSQTTDEVKTSTTTCASSNENQAAMGLTSSGWGGKQKKKRKKKKEENVHQTVFIPLSISHVLYTLSFRQATKASSLLQKTHINILFEFLTSHHNGYLTS